MILVIRRTCGSMKFIVFENQQQYLVKEETGQVILLRFIQTLGSKPAFLLTQLQKINLTILPEILVPWPLAGGWVPMAWRGFLLWDIPCITILYSRERLLLPNLCKYMLNPENFSWAVPLLLVSHKLCCFVFCFGEVVIGILQAWKGLDLVLKCTYAIDLYLVLASYLLYSVGMLYFIYLWEIFN